MFWLMEWKQGQWNVVASGDQLDGLGQRGVCDHVTSISSRIESTTRWIVTSIFLFVEIYHLDTHRIPRRMGFH